MIPRSLSLAMLALAGIAGAPQALALGFGRVPDTMVFGQPLDLTVPLRLEPGESLAPACVQADVHVGEQRLPPAALQVAVEQRGDETVVRLRAATAVHEPLVAVNLAVGCSGVVSRQFVVFADPPEVRAAVPPAALPVAALVPTAAETSLRSSAPPQVSAKVPATRKARSKPAVTSASTAVAEAPAVATRRPLPRPSAASRAKDSAPSRAVAAAPTAPRLKLEEPEALLKAAMASVAAQDAAASAAAQAASAAEAAASAAEQRMVAMEGQLRQLRDEAGASKAALEQMRGRVADAEDRARWQTLLLAAVVLLGGLVAWLAWRLRALQRERQHAWWQAAASASATDAAEPEAQVEASSVQSVPSLRPDVPAPAAAPLLSDSALSDLDEVPPAPQPPGVLPPQPKAEELLAHPLSVDELIDLEQQAEFFLVLGEEESAIDLLMSHLRSAGGTSPLPYLKLLEIYRRREDREAYERMRKRFSQRFNAVAPDWDADPHRGRELLDYPAVLATLQAKWPQPLDAMTELENLLFRKRSGELFELPAYRDVLSLYSVARDLHRQVDDPSADVDVLLPLADEASRRAGPPSIFDTAAILPDEAPADERPTAPVDLDLSEPELVLDSRPAPLAPAGAPIGRL